MKDGERRLKSNKEVYEKIEKITDTMKKRRVTFYGHLKRLNLERETKRIFDFFDSNPKTKLTWFIEVKKDLEEMKIEEEDVENRNEFRRRVKQFEGFQEKRKRKTGAKWTEERKKQHSERMKKYWSDRKMKNNP